jgi:hypothetical protein
MDDVDEDELTLAMSTELTRPSHPLVRRRTRSLTSLKDAQCSGQPPFLADRNRTSRGRNANAPLANLDPKPIKIHDHSIENQDKDDTDGLWASKVTVTEPSIVKGNQSSRLQAMSGYVGSLVPLTLLTSLVWLCTVETFEVGVHL